MKSFCKLRHFSMTSAAFKSVKRKPNYLYPLKIQRDAQDNLKQKEYPEIVEAQKKRVYYEYPVQADLRASWKHRRWYDVFYDKWVPSIPELSKEFSLNKKSTRTEIFKAETPYELFNLLLNNYERRKYFIESFNHETCISNISYYYQHLTNTKYIYGLPLSISNSTVYESYLEKFENFVSQQLLFEHNNETYKSELDPLKKNSKITSAVMKSIMEYLVATLQSENPLLSECEVDHNVDNCMFWFRGEGFLKWTLPDDHPIAFQCHDSVFHQIRTKEPLPAFSSRLGEFSTSGNLPSFDTTPHVFAFTLFQYANTITPGYRLYAGDCYQNYQNAWDEDLLHELPPPAYDQCRYGHTQMLLLPETYSRHWYKESLEHCDITGEIDEHLKGKGIMSGWVWTAAQAHYHQHWMDNDITKPFCTQNIVSDGQWLSFFCYQLNTIAIDACNAADNPFCNLCYGQPSVKLFDEVTDEEVVGLNKEALSLLVRFVRNGVKQHHSAVASEEQLEDYNKSLQVQEVDPENPDIEVQKPLHKLERDRLREEAEKAREKEEYENSSIRTKLKNMLIGN